MKFMDFTELIADKLADALGKEYSIKPMEVTKNNSIKLCGLSISKTGCNVAPMIYLEDFYEDYKDGTSIDEISGRLITLYKQRCDMGGLDVDLFNSLEAIKDKISYKLVNYDKNKAFLKSVPYRRFLDLAVIYQVNLGNTQYGLASAKITNEHLQVLGCSEDDLWEYAEHNTPLLYEPEIMSLQDMIHGLMNTAEATDPDLMSADSFSSNEVDMFVLTNKSRINGASCILYRNIVESFVNMRGHDYYIIPSSVHEMLLIGKPWASLDKIRDIVRQVNDTQVSAEEILSYNVYEYSNGRFSITESSYEEAFA